jgi:hypothetical protein
MSVNGYEGALQMNCFELALKESENRLRSIY